MMQALSVPGTWLMEPKVHVDHRGSFHEWFQDKRFTEQTGHSLVVAQANLSVSRRGTLRGIHFTDVPPGQAKYVKCVRGAVLDVAIDLRVGSPTYRRWESVRLDDQNHRSLYLSEGIGHAFMALTEDASVLYLCSTAYAPEREHGINPLDPELGINWPDDLTPILSKKDASAPGLAEAQAQGLLPEYSG